MLSFSHVHPTFSVFNPGFNLWYNQVMTILITNDDGITGEGLIKLAEDLSEKHDVWIVAPDKNRSAISHGINLSEPVEVKKIGEKAYTCSGTPVDCVEVSVKGFLPFKADAVISGINKGGNLGTDLVFSGTAGAARQGGLYGIPSIAVSLENRGAPEPGWHYGNLSRFVSAHLEELLSMCQEGTFVNVNGLSLADDRAYKGACITYPAKRIYSKDTLQRLETLTGKVYSCFIGGPVETDFETKPTFASPAGKLVPSVSDVEAVEKGYVSITVVKCEPTALPLDSYPFPTELPL